MPCSSYDLPLDVFGPDEKRPERTVKKKLVKKRTLENGAEVCLIS